MTKKELFEKLKGVPDDMEVFICQTNDEYQYSLAEQAFAHEITFGSSETPKKEWAKVECFVIID